MKNISVRWILVGLTAMAGIYLIADHGQHLAPYLPFAFLLGMLAMHLFMPGMHGGHGGNGGHGDAMEHTHDNVSAVQPEKKAENDARKHGGCCH